MSNMLTIRNLVWATALGFTIWLSWHAPEEKSIVQARRDSMQIIDSNKGIVTMTYENQFHLTPRTINVKVHNNIFAVPDEKIVLARPQDRSEPSAPPLPFSYLGSVIENGEKKIFLNMGEQMLIVKVGELIDDRYKLIAIEKIGNRSRLKFSYLPMKLTQTMVVNNAN